VKKNFLALATILQAKKKRFGVCNNLANGKK